MNNLIKSWAKDLNKHRFNYNKCIILVQNSDSKCYIERMFVSPKLPNSYDETYSPMWQYLEIEFWGSNWLCSHEQNQCSYKRGPSNKLPHPFCLVRLQHKDGIYEPRSGSSLDAISTGALILDFLAYRPVENAFLLFIKHLDYGVIVIAAAGMD